MAEDQIASIAPPPPAVLPAPLVRIPDERLAACVPQALRQLYSRAEALRYHPGRSESAERPFLVTSEEVVSDDAVYENFDYLGTAELRRRFPAAQVSDTSFRRPLLFGVLHAPVEDQLFLDLIEVSLHLQGHSIANGFYENLAVVAAEAGYRFLVEFHASEEAASSAVVRGCYPAAAILDERQAEFAAAFAVPPRLFGIHRVAFTVRFLNPQDPPAYLKPDYLGERPYMEGQVAVAEAPAAASAAEAMRAS